MRELEELLAEIERLSIEAWADRIPADDFVHDVRTLFLKARLNTVIRYPVPA